MPENKDILNITENSHGDDIHDSARIKMRDDPFIETRRRIVNGRRLAVIIAAVNAAAVISWMITGLVGLDPNVPLGDVAYIVGYGAAMLACCVGLVFGKEWARKLMGIPALLLGVPLIMSFIINPTGLPTFMVRFYAVAIQIISVAILYFQPWSSAFFTASPNAKRRAFNKKLTGTHALDKQ